MIQKSGPALWRRIGDIGQVASVRPVRFADGPEDGLRALDVRTMDGLHAIVLIDRGLDLGPAWYRGMPIAWTSGTGFTHPAYYREDAWLRSFGGGLMVTCGLQNVGPPATDDGVSYGLHGRVSNIPASQVSWEAASSRRGATSVVVHGRVREASAGGADLVLYRTIRFAIGEPVIEIDDVVQNLGHEPAPLMILYHVNVGFPVVDDTAEVVTTAERVVTRDGEGEARRDVPHAGRIGPPRRGSNSDVFEHLHSRPKGAAGIAVVNEDRDLGIGLTYRIEQLPRLWQWRSRVPGLYLIGLEPANCGVDGRVAERATGNLDVLAPRARRHFGLRLFAGPAQHVRDAIVTREDPDRRQQPQRR